MFKERYQRRRKDLLKNTNIISINRKIVKDFLEYEEYKLKRKQGLSEVDERSYKTLYFYIGRLKNLNDWFENKSWKSLTKNNIKKLIDDLEDGVIKTRRGTRFADRAIYYQMLKGKLFKIAGVNSYVTEIFDDFELKGRNDSENPVKFIEEKDFRKIVDCAITPEQRCLLWLAFDIGENIGSLLLLEKKDIQKQINPDTNEAEYLIILPKENLKRSRTARSEITNYPDTVKYLDVVLANVKPTKKIISNGYFKNKKLSEIHNDNKLFKFGFDASNSFFKRIVEKSNVRCMPEGQKVTWKDLRSSMACDLLKKEWSRDEVNARLGHKPSSRIIDRYINFLALDRHKPKKKLYNSNLKKIEIELEKQKDQNKLQGLRLQHLKKDQDIMKKELLEQFKKEILVKIQN